MAAIDHNGFRIRGSISQAAIGADWRLTVSTQTLDLAVIDDDDETHVENHSSTIPFNEAPSEAAVTVRLQEMVDGVFDNIPVPTP